MDSIELQRKKLVRRMMRSVDTYGLIERGDKIMVAVSGGKDSYTLLDLLAYCQKRSPFPFELVAVHLVPRQRVDRQAEVARVQGVAEQLLHGVHLVPRGPNVFVQASPQAHRVGPDRGVTQQVADVGA